MAKGGYVGVNTEFPIYEVETVTDRIYRATISTYFDVENSSPYYFAENYDSGFFSNNHGNGTEAISVWTAKYDMPSVSITYLVSSEENYDKLTIKVGNTTLGPYSGNRSGTWNGSMLAGEKIQLSYKKDSSTSEGDDWGGINIMNITCEKRTQIGTETKSVARKITGGYVGIDGIARKIKKAYIGIGGIARPCFGGGKPTYYGSITSLSGIRYNWLGGSFDQYALFFTCSEDHDAGAYNTYLDYYDENLTYAYKTATTWWCYDPAAFARNDNYAVFCGGYRWDDDEGSDVSSTVHLYDTNLTYTSISHSGVGEYMAGARVGQYALFEGSPRGYSACAVNNDGTSSTPQYLSDPRGRCGATSLNGRAMFAGGAYTPSSPYTEYDTVDLFDENLTRTLGGKLSAARYDLNANVVGGYAVFSENSGTTSGPNVFDVFDDSYTLIFTGNLIEPRYNIKTIDAGDYIMFTGGGEAVWPYSSVQTVTYMDSALTQTVGEPMQLGRQDHGLASNSKYVVLAGGNWHNTSNAQYTNGVEAYLIG